MQKRWNILQADPPAVEQLSGSLGINPHLCEILVQRGIDTFNKAKKFFRPQLSDLYDPWLMKDMDKAVERIITAFSANEKILVFGDYDVDGTTSVACMTRFLRRHYSTDNTDFYIPHRYREGYGISRVGIDHAKANNFSLIISLDCGIKSIELIAYAKSLGLDFIVCDHHLPDDELPPAIAILNAKQKDCNYPYKELCGCGVGFKLITALCQRLGIHEDEPYAYLDLLATAIAADIVPMTDENRCLTYYGLKKLNSSPSPGIAALMKLSGVKGVFNINNVVFTIAPRINAAGRMDDARKAVLMFVEEESEEATRFAQMLHSDNTHRKEADSVITDEALQMIRSDELMLSRKTTVVFKSGWHKGVVGIVASRLIETFYRPTVVLTQSGDIVSGSARSIPGFNLYEAIHACRQHLIGYGGHFAAAGLSMLPENVERFSANFEKAVLSTIDPQLLIPELLIDTEIRFSDIKPGFYNIIMQMEPFGPDNTKPVFITKGVVDSSWSRIVKEQHVKFVLEQDGIKISGIGFNMADKFYLLQLKKPLDVVFTLDANEWNGETTIQMKVIDIRLSEIAAE